MSEPIVQQELFTYEDNEPFHFYEIGSDGNVRNTENRIGVVEKEGFMFNHWHDDLEFCYSYSERDNHYINGELVEGKRGRLIVTNSQFIHNITVNSEKKSLGDIDCIVVLIDLKFVNENFPEYKNIYFTNDNIMANEAVKSCFERILKYINTEKYTEYANLMGKSLVLELLYLAVQEGYVEREAVDNINILKNIERMKGVVSYIENHYMEHITQAEVADKFYFSSVYFSKYFKRCTGMSYLGAIISAICLVLIILMNIDKDIDTIQHDLQAKRG
jgi:AraC-like DNA-binding protein